MRELAGKIPKSRYSIVKILGDYFYIDNPVENVIDYMIEKIPEEKRLNNAEEVNKYI